MLVVRNILFENNGRRVSYEYEASGNAKKFFNTKQPYYIEYDIDVSTVPESIAIIPLLANIMPIAWFADFKVKVRDIDVDFFEALQHVKEAFKKQSVAYSLKGAIKAQKIVTNTISGTKSAMLFSGGVDAYATLIRHYCKTPDLVTLHGADIELEDYKQWNSFKAFIDTEPFLKANNKNFIKTNVREFYTYHVDLLLKDIGWWGKIQHGLSLIGALAPLSYCNNYTNIYIASSYTELVDIAWGSTPQADEKISWAGVKVHHDGYDLKRQDKVDLITQFSKDNNINFRLRVCYSELRDGFNCSNCEKCFRTILGLILNGANPNDYGFKVDETMYKRMFKLLETSSASKGQKYFWWEIMEKAKSSTNIFTFSGSATETNYINQIKEGAIDQMLAASLKKPNKGIARFKFILRHKFSGLYKFYRKLKG